MKNKTPKRSLYVAGLAAMSILLTACLHDDKDAEMTKYSITITNITNGQPLTPATVIIHEDEYQAWQVGSAAGAGLEIMAESGNNTVLLSEADASMHVDATASGSGVAMPGMSESTMISVENHGDHGHGHRMITVASMLAKTNDAFTGINGMSIDDMMVGDSKTMMTHAFDAGTEADTESSATVPALSGTPYDATRDDGMDMVTVHPGVITMDEGLTSSGLTEADRWNGPVAKIMITRTE